MDGLLCDPQLAPQLVQLMNKNLQETRKALEDLKQKHDALKAELARRRDLSTGGDATRATDEPAVPNTASDELEAALEESRRLQVENADLRGVIEKLKAVVAERGDVYGEGSRGGCLRGSCPARQTLESAMDDLRTQLDERSITCEELKARVDSLIHEHAVKESAQQARLDELRQQLNARQEIFDQKEAGYRKEIEELKRKHASFRMQVQKSLQSRVPPPPAQTPPPLPSQPPPPHPKAQAAPPSAQVQLKTEGDSRPRLATLPAQIVAVPEPRPVAQPQPTSTSLQVADPTFADMNWEQIVRYVLSRPCFPASNPQGPNQLPAAILALTNTANILSCPHRIIYPYKDRCARFLMPVARCKSATEPLVFPSPPIDLTQSFSERKEVFYHNDDGIYYVGTFICISIGQLEEGEFGKLPKETRETIIKYTFPPPDQYAKAGKENINRLRNWYFGGKAKVQYVQLRYIGFNKPFFDAIITREQRLQDAAKVVPVKRALSAAPAEEGAAAKKARES